MIYDGIKTPPDKDIILTFSKLENRWRWDGMELEISQGVQMYRGSMVTPGEAAILRRLDLSQRKVPA